MKTLRLVRFTPSQNVASRYWEENRFRRNDELQISSLTLDQQAIVAGAMAWAQSKLPEGFTGLESVELRRESDIPTAWNVPEKQVDADGDDITPAPVPTAFGPSFVASIVGNGQLGQQAAEIHSDQSEAFVALAQLWDQLST